MKVLAFDPGETVGVALYDDGEVTGGTVKTYSEIAELIVMHRPSTVVIENFFIRRGKPSNYSSAIKQIGMIEYVCEQHGLQYILQSPAILRVMMKHVSDSVKISHTRSATAHLMYYLLRNGIVESGWRYELKVGELK